MTATTEDRDTGLGLVELVIAMFLLAVITVAILPALLSGIRYSAVQSTTATATRQLNALVEQVRQSPSCANASAAVAAKTFRDGAGHPFTTQGTSNCGASGSTASLALTAKAQNGGVLASINALVYIP